MKRSRSATAVVDLAADRARAFALTPVSRETSQRLDRFVELLLRWQRTTNLIAPSTIPKLWTRHIADSLQLIDLVPDARAWVDLGSGGGFPGLVIACVLAERSGALVHLVESNAKKAAFLREAQRVTEAPVRVHLERIDEFAARLAEPVDVVSARAVAPLNSLLDQAFPLLGKNGVTGLFLKGQNAELEVGEASKNWNIKVNLLPSRTDPAGRIVVIRSLARAAG
ncbi:MAG TPA: 16S rRNA (guanine(527)-N(7))-methyltransferase RsmG [Xanthobacteraceae bacterium]|nr:16S rRNA (guanine(527)-N(7))-methyltransferase RsmG [Xanthobacteraceae bacterium]